MVQPLLRLHHVRGERKALMAARPFVPEAEDICRVNWTFFRKGKWTRRTASLN